MIVGLGITGFPAKSTGKHDAGEYRSLPVCSTVRHLSTGFTGWMFHYPPGDELPVAGPGNVGRHPLARYPLSP